VVGSVADEAGAVRWMKRDPNATADLFIVDVFLRSGTGLGVLKRQQLGVRARRVVLTNYATGNAPPLRQPRGRARVRREPRARQPSSLLRRTGWPRRLQLDRAASARSLAGRQLAVAWPSPSPPWRLRRSWASAKPLLGADEALRRSQARHVARNDGLRLRELLTDAETAQRGYLLTGRDDYLAPIQLAERELPSALAPPARPVRQLRVGGAGGRRQPARARSSRAAAGR
jgi:hypothetical protein